ncbi:hypothetical protein GJ744_000761 [Endocarpon pusillum]|uniref:Uncharacterized protein n=1 Tax=Endocarpon pusillum TaxID=364733 RepID=A0A8H7DZW0_9EURO|nr:hypothetical protein GJ744_000761 [Endocarpon pusillum]
MFAAHKTAIHTLSILLIQSGTKFLPSSQIARAAPCYPLCHMTTYTSFGCQGGKKSYSSLASSRSGRTETPALDDAYTQGTNQIPTDSDYPEMSELISENPKSVIHGIPRGNCKSSSVFLGINMQRLYRYQATVELFGSQRMSAIGEATRKKEAEKAAYLHIVTQLHQKGLLKLAYSTKYRTAFNDKELAQDRRAKHDVYNYAASFLSVPRFHHVKLAPELTRNGETVYKTVVEFSDRSVKGEGVDISLPVSERIACLNFLKESQRREGAKRKTRWEETPATFRTSDIIAFWAWYRFEHPTTKLRMIGPSRAGIDGLLKAQVLMDGKPLGEAAVLSGIIGEENGADYFASMTAAVALLNTDVDLFQRYLIAIDGQRPGRFWRPGVQVDAETPSFMRTAVSRVPEPTPPYRCKGWLPAIFDISKKAKSLRKKVKLGIRKKVKSLRKKAKP